MPTRKKSFQQPTAKDLLSKMRRNKIFRIIIAAAVALLALALVLFMNKIEYGIYLLVFLLICFLVWKAFIQSKEDADKRLLIENSEKDNEIENLKQQLESQRQSSLNITEVKDVFKIINQEVNFMFYRPVIKTEEHDGSSYTFKGVAQIEGKALFGVDLDKLKYKIDSGVLYVGQEEGNYAISCEFTPTWLFYDFLKDPEVKHRKILNDKYINAKEDEYSIRRLPEISTELMSNIQNDIKQRKISELMPNIEQTKKTLQNALASKYPSYTITLVDVDKQDSSYQLLSSLNQSELTLLESRTLQA